jgi:hypothetical protein
MGIITSLPINTSTIPELTAYGVVDSDAKLKDLIEITKNDGTSVSPNYPSGASRKIPMDEFLTLLGGAGGLIKSVEYVPVLDNRQTSDTFTNVTLDANDDKKYFVLEILGRPATTQYVSGFNVIFPTSPTDGYCVWICFISNWYSKNNFDEYKFSSGFTYLCTWSEELGEWLYDKQKSITKHKNSYIWLDAYYTTFNFQAYEGGQTYYIKWAPSYSSAQTLFCTLPPLRYNIGETVEFILLEDMPEINGDMPERFKFIGWTGGDAIQDLIIPANDGLYIYRPPANLKKGSSFKFKAIWDIPDWQATDQLIQGWMLETNLVM